MGETTPFLRGKNERRHPHEKEQSTTPKNPQLPALHHFTHHRRKGGDRVSTNKTPNLELHRWEPLDRFTRAEFNDNFTKIDATWGDLSTAVGALSGKLGRSELIYSFPAFQSGSGAISHGFPPLEWDEWEYVCALVSVTTVANPSQNTPMLMLLWGPTRTYIEIPSLSAPGFLVVFLPRHNGANPAAGFVISDHLVPFSAKFPYNELSQISVEAKDISILLNAPAHSFFGGK